MKKIKYYLLLIIAYIMPIECYGYIQMLIGDCNEDQCSKCKHEYIKSIKTKYNESKRV